MSSARSVISVAIVGSVKGLQNSLKTADKQLGTFGASVGGLAKLFAGIRVGQAVGDFIKDSVKEADKLGDATARLDSQLPPDLAGKIEDVAGSFHTIGLSKADVLTMSANIIELGKAVHINLPFLANSAPKIAEFASAIAQLGGTVSGVDDPDAIANLIIKAAGGAAKAAKDLGVTLLDPKTTSAGDQLINIMSQLAPKVATVTDKTGDLEKKQRDLQARWRDVEAEVGGPLSEAFGGVLDFILAEADALPGAMDGWKMLSDKITGFIGPALPDGFKTVEDFLQKVIDDIPRTIQGFKDLAGGIGDFARLVASPLGNVNDLIGGIGDAIANVERAIGRAFGGPLGGNSEGEAADTIRRFRERNGLP